MTDDCESKHLHVRPSCHKDAGLDVEVCPVGGVILSCNQCGEHVAIVQAGIVATQDERPNPRRN